MRKMGSKAGAKELMAAAGVPVVPGYTGADQSHATLSREAARIGFPLMIKAAHGGGGKGMRIVHRLDDFIAQLESCQREAANAFGRDRVLLERYVQSPRHIEIQVFADAHGNALHLGERECSAQRRYQKVLEESPSPFLTPGLRAAMGEAAVKAAHAIDYANAGTVEFIVDPDGGFYFMEINTRLQVEHPVTELVTGVDLVHLQLHVAAGGRLEQLLAGRDLRPRGHAIEARICAESPEAGYVPAAGKLRLVREPEGPGVRVDSGVYSGWTVPPFYDSMLAKLVVWAPDRASACARLSQALRDSVYLGIPTNVDFLRRIVDDAAFRAADLSTDMLKHRPELAAGSKAPPSDDVLAAAVLCQALQRSGGNGDERAAGGGDGAVGSTAAWQAFDGFRAFEESR